MQMSMFENLKIEDQVFLVQEYTFQFFLTYLIFGCGNFLLVYTFSSYIWLA
jgi:hypothetical protein